MNRRSRNFAFLAALVAGLGTALACRLFETGLSVGAGANAFFLVYLVLALSRIRILTPDYLRRNAASFDLPAGLVLVAMFGAVLIAIVALFLVIAEGSSAGGLELALALASVALGWASTHTLAAFHYAHLFWTRARTRKGKAAESGGGLDFPGTETPCGWDFLYFAFVVGMTAQTSDVAITTTAMRRTNLIHSVVSFVFNTVLVAAAVNFAVSLGQ